MFNDCTQRIMAIAETSVEIFSNTLLGCMLSQPKFPCFIIETAIFPILCNDGLSTIENEVVLPVGCLC